MGSKCFVTKPHGRTYHPISTCDWRASCKGGAKSRRDSSVPWGSSCQDRRSVMRKVIKMGWVWTCVSQPSSVVRRESNSSMALCSVQMRMCSRCSPSSPQRGHSDEPLYLRLTITTPVAVCTHFDIKIWIGTVAFFLAVRIASQYMLVEK